MLVLTKKKPHMWLEIPRHSDTLHQSIQNAQKSYINKASRKKGRRVGYFYIYICLALPFGLAVPSIDNFSADKRNCTLNSVKTCLLPACSFGVFSVPEYFVSNSVKT